MQTCLYCQREITGVFVGVGDNGAGEAQTAHPYCFDQINTSFKEAKTLEDVVNIPQDPCLAREVLLEYLEAHLSREKRRELLAEYNDRHRASEDRKLAMHKSWYEREFGAVK